jgi:hypothetical protein
LIKIKCICVATTNIIPSNHAIEGKGCEPIHLSQHLSEKNFWGWNLNIMKVTFYSNFNNFDNFCSLCLLSLDTVFLPPIDMSKKISEQGSCKVIFKHLFPTPESKSSGSVLKFVKPKIA